MNVSINTQTLIFLYSILLGQCIGIVYDFFRAIRQILKFKTLNTFVCDTLFWLISLSLFFWFMLNIASGEGRFYIIFAIVLGISLYFLCISAMILEIFKKIVYFAYFVFSKVYNILNAKIKKLLKNTKKPF